MKKILACALAAVLLAGCGSGSLLGNNDALAASVGSRASSAASNSVNSKINSDRIAPALNSVKAAGRNSGTDEISVPFFILHDFYMLEKPELPKEHREHVQSVRTGKELVTHQDKAPTSA